MGRTTLITIAVVLVQSLGIAFAQTEEARLIDYLVNPTNEERAMFKDMSLSQIKDAIALYDSNSLIDQLRDLNAEIKDLQQKTTSLKSDKSLGNPKRDSLRSMIINQIQLLRMTGERKNIDRVLKMVRNLIESDPSDITFMKPYLDVMFQTGDWDECDRVLALFEANCQDEYDFARILQNKASVANGRNKIPQSIELYHKALEIYQKYVEKEGWDYKDIATKVMVSNNILSQLYYRLEEEDSCKFYMNEVLKIGDIAARYDSIDGTLGYASACNGIANKFMSYGDSLRADSVYAIAYRFIEEAYDKAPFRNGSTYVFYYMNHARDNMNRENYAEAVENSEKALEVMTRLYRVFPKWSSVNYFEALRLRASLYTMTNDFEMRFNMLKDAEAELDEIEMDSPNSNQLRYFNLYYDFAINKANSEDVNGAIAYLVKAKEAVRDLDPRIRDRNTAICDRCIEQLTEELTKGEETDSPLE